MDIHKASTIADSPAGRLNAAFLQGLHELDAALIGYDVVSEADFEWPSAEYLAVVVMEGCSLTPEGEAILPEWRDGARSVFDLRRERVDVAESLAARRDPAAGPVRPLPLGVRGDLFESEYCRAACPPARPRSPSRWPSPGPT